MAVCIAVVSMAALIILRLEDYTRNGLAFFLIPVSVCLVLLGITLPLIRYFRKTWGDTEESGYFQAANLFAIFSMVSFILVRLPEYISSALYFRAFVLLTTCLLVIGITIVLMIKIQSPAPLAFYIPAVTFALYTLGTAILGGSNYYFLTYLAICGFGALYTRYEGCRNFVFLSHALILCLVIAKVPLLGPGMSHNDLLLHWLLALYTTNFFLMLSRFSAEKSSRSARAQDTFDTLMASTPNLLVMVDEMNRVTYLSKPMAELARIEDHEIAAGRPVVDLFHDIDMKLVIGEILESGGFYDSNLEMLHNGRKRHFRIISDQFPGNTPGRFIDISDITPIIEARLEAEEAKALAEEANSAKSAFLARMSHEIRTPMNAITGMSELILREEASPLVHEHAAAVKQAGSNLVAIINDILDFSRIESGKMEIVPTEYDFSSLINDIITIIRIRLRERPIYFVVNVDSAIPRRLYGDVVRVRQILLNLLSNAVKYTAKGHIIFTVDLEEREDESPVLKFEITDTGIGIKPEDMGKLFVNFSRLDSLTNRGVEGTGLGLAITRNLCRAMGGDITVESEYREGSTFTAYIPQTIRDKAPFAAVSEPENKRVLIYETREVYGNSIVCSVDNLGVFCKQVALAKDFAAALETDRFDFIFVASFLFEKARQEIQKRELAATLVLLAEYGEVITERQVRFIAMPAHSISIANILNGVEELRGYNEDKEGIRFTAPDARVLVVDDIKTNLDVAEGLLSPYAMQVDTCLSGKEALSLAEGSRYDLVLMDHMMPGMDGIETVQSIRALPGEYFQKLPIVVLTANAISGMRDMFLGMGFNDYISKPIEVVKLDALIARWIPAEKQIKTGTVIRRDHLNGETGIRIPGVDTKKGMAMTGGTGAGYRKVLTQFYKDTVERLPVFAAPPGETTGETADGTNDQFSGRKTDRQDSGRNLAAFTAQVHAIKSAAGTIGAATVSAEAAALETAGKAGDMAAVREKLSRFHKHLTELVEGIGKTLEEQNAGGDGDKQSGRGTAPDSFYALRTALEARNMKEIDRLLTELEGLSLNTKDRATINVLADKILMGEYQEAIDELDRLSAEPAAAADVR
jgi:signal transduction histidine kinase/CheY-like chemotaxis protein/HPt (histidine-containing phosphotransfer) domain-containing protein